MTRGEWRLYKATPTGQGLWEYYVDGRQIASLVTRDGLNYETSVVKKNMSSSMLATVVFSGHTLLGAQAEVENIVHDMLHGE